mgnify:FL=1
MKYIRAIIKIMLGVLTLLILGCSNKALNPNQNDFTLEIQTISTDDNYITIRMELINNSSTTYNLMGGDYGDNGLINLITTVNDDEQPTHSQPILKEYKIKKNSRISKDVKIKLEKGDEYLFKAVAEFYIKDSHSTMRQFSYSSNPIRIKGE